ncbi:MAG: aspartate aminotransferase family protein [Paracoccaceae bacterium]|jgi:acetylornithine/N-succinyldiaminopimelate aminotransferase|nr:MAG: acetylornithine aminotransferase [Rhodobacter sp. BACL10 MAG-121220-bin24]MDA0354987.1 aspartate aminotransferase family protein [Pseudomonadota bacterium]MDO7568364.1 aspartate aminotransferase family protein [Paracoccaceae bacterium]HCM98871.1 acetylornithine transaminase [Rhodobacter sp.]MDA1042835.1 aspartate aminotransferase family protein [Pseudomonadota bacterium]
MNSSVLATYNRAALAFDHGQGSWLVATDGTRYLDLTAGIAVNALGHAHPALVTALAAQGAKLWHVSNLYTIPEQEVLAQKLTDLTFADTVFFTNSGTEAAELAIKMARKYWHDAGHPQRQKILTFDGAFHGRSTGAIAAAASEKMTKGFGALMPGFESLPFGDHEALRNALSSDVAAVMIEPVQGEGGIRLLPDACLKGLRDLCDATGALLIMDEVQCGMGRTGRLFAHEWAGVTPDIMMVAKGIGGGFPLGAVLATQKASAAMVAGTHGSTYGGNPLACAIGNAVVNIISEEAFLAEVRRKAALFAQGLESLVARHSKIFETWRGQGLMLGLKCKIAPLDLVRAGQSFGLLMVPAADNVVRLLPALTITDDDISQALQRLDDTARTLSAL